MNFLKKLLIGFFAALGVLTFCLILLIVFAVKQTASRAISFKEDVPPKSLMILNTSSIVGDVFPGTNFLFLDSFLNREISLIDALISIRAAAKDPKILAIFLEISELNLSYAQIEELRGELLLFKQSSGKPVYVWSDSFGDIGNGVKSYYLASAFDKIYIQPSGVIAFNGLSATYAFYKKSLEKLKIKAISSRRKEYKTAWNSYIEEKFTESHKESTESLINSIFYKIAFDISKSRNLSLERVYSLADSIALTAEEGVKENLIDGTRYRDEVLKELETAVDFRRKISVATYKNIAALTLENFLKPKIALIEVPGTIHRGVSDISLSGYPESSGSATIVSLLKKAWDDEKVAGIIMRVNSPGGSAIASETIWRQIEMMKRENKKPLVVSMGSVAASGGYYVSMAADKIFADHATITGSIGVILGKFYMRDFFQMLGVTFDSVSIGKNSNVFSPFEQFTPEQNEYFEKTLDALYDSFVQRAAEGRKMDKIKLEKLAKGRVWSGDLAQKGGLVDSIGGFMDALDFIKSKAGKSDDYLLVKYPEPAKLLDILTNSEDDGLFIENRFGKIGRLLNVVMKKVDAIQREIEAQNKELYQIDGEPILN